jgi:hypothetical protein
MTDVIDESRPSLGEQYGVVATSSGNLRAGEQRTDLDYVHAAGLASQSNGLGVLLFRLQAEYDSVKGPMDQAVAFQAQQEKAVKREAGAIAARVKADEVSEEEGAGLAEAVRRRSQGEILAARALILSQLKTLDESKQALGAFAVVLATKVRYMKPDAVVLKLAGRVLDVFLDPLCHHCDGTGREGNEYRGEKVTPCKPCGGTAHRRSQLGNDDAARGFAWRLLLEMNRLMGEASSSMAHKLHSTEPSTEQPEQEAALQAKLRDLRSPEAQAD